MPAGRSSIQPVPPDLSLEAMQEGKAGRLATLFAPRSVALVGVSDSNNMSLCIHRNMVRHGFAGPAHYINPRRDVVHGRKTLPALSSIGEPVDLAFLMVGGERLLDVVDEAGRQGIRNLVLLAGGFGEVGEGGRRRQQDLVQLAERHGQLLLGPNTIGFVNPRAGSVFYGSPLLPPAYPDRPIEPGTIGGVVQSGSIAYSLLRAMYLRQAGPSVIAATGNEASIGIHDIVDYLVDDPGTRVIALFVETVRDAPAFRAACERALIAGKPIVAMKVGRSPLAVRGAVSHTGALIGDDRVSDAALDKLGVITVRSIEDLVTTAILLDNYGAPRGNRAAFVAISGGVCEIFADRAQDVGLLAPDFAPETVARLQEILPDTATVMNPLDTTGIAQTDTTIFPRVFEAVTQDPNVDVLVVARNVWRLPLQDDAALVGTFRAWGEAIRRSPIPVMLVSDQLTDIVDYERDFRARTGIPPELGGIEHGLAALGRAARWSSYRDSYRPAAPSPAPDREAMRPAGLAETGIWSERHALAVLAAAGVPTVPFTFVRSAEEAVAAADAHGQPVVLKVCSEQLPHKSDIGGVALDLTGPQDIAAAYEAVTAGARSAGAHIRVDGALVMPMRPRATELIVGIRRDHAWGLALMIGLGGVWTEVLNDTVVTPLPLLPGETLSLLARLRGARMLAGGHGQPAADLERLSAVIDTLVAAARGLGDRLESLEVNPLRVAGGQIEALDALIVWQADGTELA